MSASVEDENMRAKKLSENDLVAAGFFLGCCICPCIILIFGSSIAYFTFGIIFLVKDAAVCGHYSKLWIFSIISLLLHVFASPIYRAQIESPEKSAKDPNLNLKMIFVLELAIVIWGSVLFYYPGMICEHMKHTGLYVWAVLNYSISSFYLVFAYCGLFCLPSVEVKQSIDEESPLFENESK
jgi:uncharacterized membrane protein